VSPAAIGRAALLVAALLLPRVARAQDAGSDAGSDAGADEGPPLVDPDDPAQATAAEDEAAARALGPDDDAGAPEGAALPDVPAVASEIAAMSARTCLRAMVRAHIDFERPRHFPVGVGTPVIVRGPIRGVTYHDGRGAGVRELMDCRLAVALARYATFLRTLHIREVRHLSLWRVAGRGEALRDGLYPRHPGGLAIDAGTFVRDDGTALNVLRDYHGRRGRPPCGPSARVPPDPAARLLRTLQCEPARRGWFHVVLGPNFNFEHRNHLHLEVVRDVSWNYIR
jgi:hypothetical protein